ncbi:MAG TPA: Rrf2 family transcriptional regulator [Propionibacteriaceae bacterium]|nr:Rrf2 family transcriptional regulator [Propionibacteriaceae bacterium]
MHITRGTDVALRTMMLLARSPEPKVSISRVAEQLNLPERHVGKIVQVLAHYGWVATVRGRTGGVVITSAGLGTSADTVMAAIEGDEPVLDCFDPPCPLLHDGCALKEALDSAQHAFRAHLAGATIAELAGVPDDEVEARALAASAGHLG